MCCCSPWQGRGRTACTCRGVGLGGSLQQWGQVAGLLGGLGRPPHGLQWQWRSRDNPGSLEAMPLSPSLAVGGSCVPAVLGPLVPWGWSGQGRSVPQLHTRFFAQLEDPVFPIESFSECQTVHQPPLSATGGFTSQAPASLVVESKLLGSKPRTWSGKHRPGLSAHATSEQGRSQLSIEASVLSLAGCCWQAVPCSSVCFQNKEP